MFCKAKSATTKKTFFCGDFRPLPNKYVPVWDHFIPLLFPKDSESLKILDIRLREVWAKKRLHGTSKVNRQTDKQTDKQTDILIYRKHQPRGPMLWKNIMKIIFNWTYITNCVSLPRLSKWYKCLFKTTCRLCLDRCYWSLLSSSWLLKA